MQNGKRDLFERCRHFNDARRIQATGLYPYFRVIQESSGSSVYTDQKKRVMIGSNNYLGLTHHPRVQVAAASAIAKYGTGCTGSRFLNGNLDLHEELERKVADFVGKESALVFSTGFLTNQGVISCLVGERDVIYSDRENHASIVEGTRLADGEVIKFNHNDMSDLERALIATRGRFEGAIIVVDGVFSMSGAIADLPGLARLAQQYDCRLYVDDAHSLGVLGPNGRGTGCHFGIQDSVDLVMGTFSKSLASIGGFIAGPDDVIHYVKHKSRPFMFSAAMPPAAAATVLECLRVIEEEPEHIQNLWTNTHRVRKGFARIGVNMLDSETPIIPIVIGEDMAAFAFTQRLYEYDIFATPVVKPAVGASGALIRTSYMASHTEEDLDYVIAAVERLMGEFVARQSA